MLPVPAPRTFNVDEVEVAAYMNAVRDALTFLLNPPAVVATQATPQSIGSGSAVALALDSTVTDPYGMHSNTTNNTRAVAPVSGYWQGLGSVTLATNASGARQLQLAHNGTSISYALITSAGFSVTSFSAQVATDTFFAAAGDYFESDITQTSGSSLTTGNAGCSSQWRFVHA